MAEPAVTQAGEHHTPVARLPTGWVVAIGIAGMIAAAGVPVLLPVVVPAVVTWWLWRDLVERRRRVPGWLGIAALAVLTIVGVLAAGLVVGFDTHFDCGGTLGGYGESASARLDEKCAQARSWRTPVAMVSIGVSGIAAGVAIGVTRRRGAGTFDRPRAGATAVATVVGLTALWTIVVLAFVTG